MISLSRRALLIGALSIGLVACSTAVQSPSPSEAEPSASAAPSSSVVPSADETGLTGESAAYATYLAGNAECTSPRPDADETVFTCTFSDEGADYETEIHVGSDGAVSGSRVTVTDPTGAGFGGTNFTTIANNIVGSTAPFFGDEAETAFNELFAAGSSGSLPDDLEIDLPESGAKLMIGTPTGDPDNTIVFLAVPGPNGLILD